MIRTTLLTAGALAALAACGTVPTSPLASLFDIPATCTNPSGLSTNMICAGSDLVQTVASKPEPRRTFAYSEDDAFDLQLSSSLGAGLEKVTVTVPDTITLPLKHIADQAVPTVDSERLVFWLAQIRNTGGEVKACEIQLESAIVGWLVQMGADYMKQRLTYGPADKYDAVVRFDSQTEGAPIREIVFTPRTGTPLSCS